MQSNNPNITYRIVALGSKGLVLCMLDTKEEVKQWLKENPSWQPMRHEDDYEANCIIQTMELIQNPEEEQKNQH